MKRPRHSWRGRVVLAALLAALAAGAVACSDSSYYWQAVSGEIEIIHKSRPIEVVLADPAVSEQTKARLRLALRVQEFSVANLGLPSDGSYRTYADLGRDYVSWLVVAAPALEMKETTWCYPVVGCLGYRGYFSRADADAFAEHMRAEGYDVMVRPVRAYSTLGWLDDPLLNTFVQQDMLELMATLIHEQAHRRLWVKGDTEFNESFAVFVEQEGLRRFLEHGLGESGAGNGMAPEALLNRYRLYQADQERFQELAQAGRQRLVELYASPLGDAEKRARKGVLLEEIRRDYQKQRSSFRLLNYDDWFGPNLNNAYLAGIAQYHVRIDAFAALFNEEGRDFGRFYTACEALGRLGHAERQAALDRLAASAASKDKRSAVSPAPRDDLAASEDPPGVHLLRVTDVSR